ncbi:hypothetical protein NDA13_006287 [Ustilago tritici]|nr:hypothetical protein NDA13_006287 [Ustilago tritici]
MDDLLGLSWQPNSANAAKSNKPGNSAEPTPTPSSSSSSALRSSVLTSSASTSSQFATNASAFDSSSSKPNYYGSSFATPSPSASPAPNNTSASKSSSTPSNDAFASLFSSSSSAKQQANLSLAERQRLAREQSLKEADEDKRRNDALWSGIESSAFTGASSGAGSNSTTVGKPPEAAAQHRLNSPAPILPTSSNAAKLAPKPAAPANDLWDFDTFSSSVPANSTTTATKPTLAPQTQTRATPSNDPFDFDSFDQPFSAPKVALHADHDDPADDILGALAMPVSDRPKSSLSAQGPRVVALSGSASTSSAGSSRVPSPASGSRPTVGGRSAPARTASPPPHIIGQIVEMGFSPQEAKRALAQTDTGVNVEAALELLVGGAAQASHQEHDDDERLARKLQAREAGRAQSQSRGFRDSDDEENEGFGRPAYQQQQQRSHPQQPEQRRNEARQQGRHGHGPSAANADGEAAADWQQQADQIYAQASEIGTSVLNKASAFWSTAKAQAQKALEERNRAAAERSTTPSDAGSERHRNRRWGAAGAASRNKQWEGKPKWMIDAENAEANEAAANLSSSNDARASNNGDRGGFKDSDNKDDDAAQQAPEPPTRTPRRPAAPAAGVAAAMSSAASALFGGRADEQASNISRQQTPSQAPPNVPARSNASAPSAATAKAPYASRNRRGPARSAAPSPIPPKAPLKRRPIPSDASHSISSANGNKEEGNEHFRRGAYGDAEASYTRAISALESSSSSDSIRLVPLLSNRANVRLKNGDASGTIADCDQLLSIVLSLFGGSQRDSNGRVAVYRASQEASLPAELADINLRETYGKALVRRAQALEASERWKLAKADWEVLLEFEKAEGSGVKTATSNMKFAREGLHRCGKMLGEKVVGPAVSSTGPPANKAGPEKHAAAFGTGDEKASAVFANQQQKQAQEESDKFALKDSVDAKIDNWKRGKETNLRALLSSLDTIVWPELGWKAIALHQVLDQNGLKKNYTKAIARLHPDKISKAASTEQKMIASAAFHAINEAWNAQQS